MSFGVLPASRGEGNDADWPRIFALLACGIGGGLQFAKASVSFDALAAHYGATGALAGWLLSAVGLAGLAIGAAAGPFVSRHGVRRCLVAALLGASVLSFVEGALPALPLFLGLRALEGLAHLVIVVAAPTAIPALSGPARQPLAMALWGMFFSGSLLIAGIAGPVLLGMGGLSTVFLAHGLVMAMLVPVAIWALPLHGAAPAPPPGRFSPLADVLSVFTDARTAWPAVCFFCYTGMFLALQTLTPALVAPERRAGLVIAMPLVSMAATLGAGLIGNRVSPFRLTALAFAAAALASIALQAAVSQGVAVEAAAIVRMAVVSALPGAILPMVPLLCPTQELRARAFGALAQTGNLGSALGPPVFNAGLAALGPIGLLMPTLALAGGGVLLAALTGRRFAAAPR